MQAKRQAGMIDGDAQLVDYHLCEPFSVQQTQVATEIQEAHSVYMGIRQ